VAIEAVAPFDNSVEKDVSCSIFFVDTEVSGESEGVYESKFKGMV